MLFLVHNFVRVSQIDRFNHHASDATLFNRQKLQEVRLVDLSDQLANLDVTHEVLAATSTRQVHKVVTLVTASLAQLIIYLNDILLLEQPGWCILKLSHLQDSLLRTCTAHANSFLSA